MPAGSLIVMPASPPAPAHLEPMFDDITGATTNVYNGDQQFFGWGVGPCQFAVSFPPMEQADGQAFAAFLQSLQGQLNYFVFNAALCAKYPEFLMTGSPPSARYWRLKKNQRGYQIPDDRYYRFSFEMREAF